ncbi:hypothetical protein THRCLA_03511 [Thraustotheca clavata]|uniref:RING-type domain-containing protein n=1 Tax=Thraustotheca clavata TaxID=74557 RepID=A0A1W0A1T6_9STRA|nr:hypothetical protein THRCLA_03511 [Thraustotheca clavata]
MVSQKVGGIGNFLQLDEAEKHAFDRYATEKISCMQCHTVQPVGKTCTNQACGIEFARYFCDVCKFYDDDPTKDIYHCEKCRICRIGKGLGIDYFHCDKCNACMSITLKKHKCVERSLESDCPICHVYMFTSTTPVMFLPCGHCMHVACYEDYTLTNYICPLCSKSLGDMRAYFARIDDLLAQEQMPSEYSNYRSQIYCSDCERKSETKFHFVYHKCQYEDCMSYNTKVLKHFQQPNSEQTPPPAPSATTPNWNGSTRVEARSNGTPTIIIKTIITYICMKCNFYLDYRHVNGCIFILNFFYCSYHNKVGGMMIPLREFYAIVLRAWNSFASYLVSHFYGVKMRPVSGFDPAGFMFMLALLFLTVGLILVVFDKSRRGRISTYIQEHPLNPDFNRIEKRLSNVSKYVTDRAIDHSARGGLIVEMLSFNYLSRLAFTVAVFGLTSYFNALAAVVAGWRTPHVVILTLDRKDSGEKTLPDLGHDLFKWVMTKIYGQTTYIDWFDLPDEFIAFVGSIIALTFIVHPRRLLIIRRFTAIYAWINLLRAFCVAVTSLPDASPQCISQFETSKGAYKSHPIFPKAIYRAWKVLLRPSHHITCGDMVFSGHTVFLVLCAMIVTTYCTMEELNTPFTRKYSWTLPLLRYSVYAGSFFGVFAIVGTRLHYTLDVLIAIYVTIQTWHTYHWLAADNRWNIRLISWLEHDQEIHSIDHHAYRMARRTGSFKENDLSEINGDKKAQ